MDEKNSLTVFEGKSIRKTWHNNEWWFALEDVIFVLTDSVDPKQYINRMKQRDPFLAKGWVQIVHILSIQTSGGIQRMNSVNTEGAFRIIQSVPSPRAEPFKLWLAKVGYERIKEVENPEVLLQRMHKLYSQKGYSENWIRRRFDSMGVRKELTDEWKKRNISNEKDFAILTNEIAQSAFGMTIAEYKKLKKINNESLRDKMSDLELLFNMVAERSTIEIARSKNAKGFDENLKASKKGGKVARVAKDALDKEIKF